MYIYSVVVQKFELYSGSRRLAVLIAEKNAPNIHLIPKWPPFGYSFVGLQVGPFGFAFQCKIKKKKSILKGQKGQFAIKQRNIEMAAIFSCIRCIHQESLYFRMIG